MNNYNNLPPLPQPSATQAAPQQSEWTLSTYMTQVMRKVYVKMFLGLLVTAITSFLVLSSETVMTTLFQSRALLIGLCVAELAMVFILSMAINKLSSPVATLLFYVYAVLNGVTLTPIFLIYTSSSIVLTFFVTAGVFLAMSIYGYTTKSDLTKFGTFMVMALIGLIVCTIIIHWSHCLGHSENQADGNGDRRGQRGQTRHPGCSLALSRLHQPLPLPAALVGRKGLSDCPQVASTSQVAAAVQCHGDLLFLEFYTIKTTNWSFIN